MNKTLISSIAYTHNLMFFTGLIILLTFFGFSSLAAEIGLTYSIVAMINQLFSYNLKNLILFNNDREFASEVFNFRLFLGLITFIISILILENYNFKFYSNKLILLLAVIVIQQWLLEVFLIIHEIKNKYNLLNIFNLISFMYILIIVFNIIYLNNGFLVEIFSIIVLVNFLVISYFLKLDNLLNLNFLKIFKSIPRFFIFTSSISIILSIFFWRVFIYLNYEKSVAGILFSSFAIGSFIGTFFATVIGPTLIKNNIKVEFYSKVYFFISILLSLLFILILRKNIFGFEITMEKLYFYNALMYSIIGSSFMLFAVIFRLNFFYKNKNKRGYVYKNDIINSIIISIIPVIFFLYNKETILFSFLAASIISFFFYFYLYNFKYK